MINCEVCLWPMYFYYLFLILVFFSVIFWTSIVAWYFMIIFHVHFFHIFDLKRKNNIVLLKKWPKLRFLLVKLLRLPNCRGLNANSYHKFYLWIISWQENLKLENFTCTSTGKSLFAVGIVPNIRIG